MTTDICGIIVVAVENGRLDVARALIDNLLCSRISPGYTELHTACEKGQVEVVRSLLQSQKYKDNIHYCTADGITPLHVACAKDHLEVVQCLLKSFNHPNVTSAHNITPLHLACIQNHEHIVEFLLCSEKCDVNIQTSNGFTPLQIVLYSNNTRLLRLLKDNSAIGSVVVPYSRNRKQKSVPLNDGGDHLLHLACKRGDRNIVEYLVKAEQCDVEVVNKYGNTPLHIAARHNKPAIAKFLITSGCCPYIRNNTGDTPLHIACQWGCTAIVEYLVKDQHSNINATNNHGNTPLHTACYAGVTEVVRVLLSKRCNTRIVNSRIDTPQIISMNQDGDLLLHLACQWGDVNIVKYLVNYQHCDVNAINKRGTTPLHIAAAYSQVSIARFLINRGCNPDIRNISGDTPLHLACQRGEIDMVEYLVKYQRCDVEAVNKYGNTPLHTAARRNKPAIVRFLITSGCNPDTRNNTGNTPLHIACNKQSIKAIMSLILHKSNTRIKNANGDTPQTIPLNEDGDLLLHLACQWGDRNIVEYLVIDQKCNVKVVNKSGDTAVHTAACHNKPAIVGFLITSGCNQNIRNISGDTPLHTACYEQNYDTIESLVLHKSNTRIKNAKGDTPQTIPLNEDGDLLLHLACQWGDRNIVEYLVNDEQCDVNATNIHGDTPLHIACYAGATKVVRVLLTKKCNTRIVNGRNHTPQIIAMNQDGDLLLHLACQWGDVDIVKYLVNYQQCNVKAKNIHRNTPLHTAVAHCHDTIVNTLLNHEQCNVNMTNDQKDTPLHIAARIGNADICKLLLRDKRCDPNKQNSARNAPLHIAVVRSELKLVEALGENASCDFNVKNYEGYTPLHLAISCNEHCIAQYLINHTGCDPTIPDRHGNTPLHLACKRSLETTDIAYQLLSCATVDPNHVNNAGQTPVELTTNYQLIRDITYFTECKTKHAIQTYIKIFFIGNPSTGKSTLVEAICRQASKWWKLLPSPLRRVRNVPTHTAGIIPITFRSKKFGNTVLYDMAGQYEYYSSHAAVIQSTILCSPPAFIVFVNLSESEGQIIDKVKYWWSFLNNVAAQAIAPPHVILVSSHADVVKSRGEDVHEKMESISKVIQHLSSTFHFAGQIALDCRDPVSRKLSNFCSLVDQSCATLREAADINLHCHILYAFLLEHFEDQVACTVSDVATLIKKKGALLPQNTTELVDLVSSLSDRALILLVQDHASIEDSWIIFQKQTLLSEINGTLFAPKNFRQHRDFARSTGVVPFSRIKREFPQHDENMIVGFLTNLEFCFKIDDPQTLQRIEDEAILPEATLDLSSDEYYFFPALVSVKNPLQVWQPDDTMTYRCGWYYHCTHPDQFLTSRFLQVLILRLAFTFALAIDPHHYPQDDVPVLCRRCSVWKHGIGWLNRAGIETVVEVGLQCRWVSVMMRCSETVQIKCVQIRSAVINKIMTTQRELCPRVKMSESLIHSSEIKYPFTYSEELKLYSLTDIAQSIKEREPRVLDQDGRNPVLIEQLLYFEPYVGVRKEVLEVLFRPENRDTRVPEEVLSQLAEDVYPRMELYREAIQPAAMSFHEELHNEPIVPRQCLSLFRALHRRIIPTYENFHKELNRFSIFHGRNPMDMTCSISDLQTAVQLSDTRNENAAILNQPETVERSHVDRYIGAIGLSVAVHNGTRSECKGQTQPTIEVELSNVSEETPTLKELMNLPISNWYPLGIQLNLDTYQLNLIQSNNAQFADFILRCIANMFQLWLDNAEAPTYRSLVEALLTTGMVDAAKELCSKHTTSPASNGTITIPAVTSPALNGTTTIPVATSPASNGTTTIPAATSPASNGTTTIPAATSPASNGTTTIPAATSPASNGTTTIPAATSPASNGTTTIPVATSPASNGTTTIPAATSPASNGTTTIPAATSPASNGTTTIPAATSPASNGTTTIPAATSPASNGTTTIPRAISPASRNLLDVADAKVVASVQHMGRGSLRGNTQSDGEASESTGIESLYDVNKEVVGVADWFHLGLSLGLEHSTLEKIEKKNHGDIDRCMTDMLAAWLQGQDKSAPSWRALVAGLTSHAVSKKDVAMKIAMAHGMNQERSQSCQELPYSDVDDSDLDNSSLYAVAEEVVTLSKHWFHLGLALHLSYQTLETIEADYPGDSRRCMTEMLTVWLKCEDMVTERGGPSWQALVLALDSPLVRKPEVANMVAAAHKQ